MPRYELNHGAIIHGVMGLGKHNVREVTEKTAEQLVFRAWVALGESARRLKGAFSCGVKQHFGLDNSAT